MGNMKENTNIVQELNTMYEKEIIEKYVRLKFNGCSQTPCGLDINGIYFPKETIKRLYGLLYETDKHDDGWYSSGLFPLIEGSYIVTLKPDTSVKEAYWNGFNFIHKGEDITNLVDKWKELK